MRARLDREGRGERAAWQALITGLYTPGPRPDDPPADGRLSQLAELFGLSPLECDAIALLWVLAFAPELRRELFLNHGCGEVTPLMVSGLFGHPPRVRLPSEGASLAWRILEEHGLLDGNAALSLDPRIISWLEGDRELDRNLVGRVSIIAPAAELPSWPVEHTAAMIRSGLRQGVRWRIMLETEDRVAGECFAACVARDLSLPLMGIGKGALEGEEGRELAIRVQRQAFLDRVALLADSGDAAEFGRGETVPFPVQFVIAGTPLAPLKGVNDLPIPLAAPSADERLELWRNALPEAASWPGAQLRELAERHELQLGEILNLAATAPPDAATAGRRLRLSPTDDLAGLAQKIDSDFRWDDLVLPPPVEDRLREIAFEARERGRLWAEAEARRLYPQGRGLVALFAGPPGTGKTMAAQVIATELGLDLLRIDLSAVISKWVGETAQHLQRILSARSSRRSLLFFDEADALYGKRVENVRDAQDRFANMDVSHLMVALENYDGIVLLATNLKANIDPAFIRRIRHIVDFPRPDAVARLLIWNNAVGALFGAEQTDLLADDLKRVATIQATGPQIKNAALSALFVSRRAGSGPDARLLGRILARELAKDGAGLSERDLDEVLEGRP